MADTADAAFDQDEIERLFNKGKSSGEAYPFAFGLGSKAEDCGLMVHLHKPPASLKKDLKGSSKAIRKVCFGTFTMDGADVRFAPTKPLKGLVKQLKKKFRDLGMGKYRPVLVGPDGKEIDEDGLPDDVEGDEDEDEETAVGTAEETARGAADETDTAETETEEETPVAPPQPDAGALRERLMRVRTGIEGLPKDKTGPLVQAFTRVVGLVKDGKTAEAEAGLAVIEKALERLAGDAAPPAAPPEQPASGDLGARLSAALAGMVPRLRALPPGPVQGQLATQAKAVQGLIASGDTAGATAALRALAEALARAEAGGGGASAGPKPLDIWNAAKEAADVGIAKLQSALRGIGHPDTTKIAEFGLAGLSGGSIQTKLMTALFNHAGTTGEDRAKAEKALRGVISEYKGFLSSNPLVTLCDENPLGVALNLRSGLGAALDKIEVSLAA
jgi:hypothetical protein